MKRDIINLFLIITLVFLAILLATTFLIREEFIFRYILYFSADKIVKATTIEAVKAEIKLILVLLLSANILFLVLLRIRSTTVKKKGFVHSRTESIIGFIDNKKIVRLSITFLFIYFIGMCLFLVLNNDIGSDEGLYISSVQNFYKEGKFNLPRYEYICLLNQLVYYPFILIRQFTGFTKGSLRIVALFYSTGLLLFLLFLFRRYYSLKRYVVLLLLLVSSSILMFLSSSGYGEIAAFFSFLLAVFFWTNGRNLHTRTLIPAVFFALAALTKLQLLPFIIALGVIFIFIKRERAKENIALLIYTCLLWITGALIFGFLQGYNLSDIGRMFWVLGSSSGQMIGHLSIFNRLNYLNAFANALNLMVSSVVVFYYFRNFRRVSLFEKTLFTFSLLVFLWWLIFYPGFSVRNVVYSIITFYILFSIILRDLIGWIRNSDKKVYFVGTIILFLTLNFVNGTIRNIRLSNKGISDEFLFASIGYETFSAKGLRSSQEDFFDFVNEKLDPGRGIYFISVDYNKDIFTEKEFRSIKHGTENLSLPVGSYFILTYIDYKHDYIWDDLVVYLNNNANLIFKENFYEVYEITD